MDKEQVIEIVKEYKKAVLKQICDAKVYLYGSYSKGTAHPESDIDVAVVVPAIQDDWLDMSTTLWLLAPQVNYLIEPVLIDQRFPSPLYDDVLRTGIAIA
jgi:predicted nucleotidyltransferase